MTVWATEPSYNPSTIAEMALYPELRERLQYYYDSKNVPHCLFHGMPGTGKTTVAFMLAQRLKPSFTEHNLFDCSKENAKDDIMEYVKILQYAKGGLTRFFVDNDKDVEVFIFDEFHKVLPASQTILNRTLETTARNSPCFFCVNKLESVAEPIVSRCKNFGFDVAALKDDKLVMLSHHGMSINDWKDELRRVGRIVAKKAGYKIDEKIEDKTLSNNIYCVDARMYINEIGEQYDMKSFYSKSFTE